MNIDGIEINELTLPLLIERCEGYLTYMKKRQDELDSDFSNNCDRDYLNEKCRINMELEDSGVDVAERDAVKRTRFAERIHNHECGCDELFTNNHPTEYTRPLMCPVNGIDYEQRLSRILNIKPNIDDAFRDYMIMIGK